VLATEEASETRATIDGVALALERDGRLRFADVPRDRDAGRTVALHLEDASGVVGAWLVASADEIPPPPPEAWDAGRD
jgi:hypothetical protein